MTHLSRRSQSFKESKTYRHLASRRAALCGGLVIRVVFHSPPLALRSCIREVVRLSAITPRWMLFPRTECVTIMRDRCFIGVGVEVITRNTCKAVDIGSVFYCEQVALCLSALAYVVFPCIICGTRIALPLYLFFHAWPALLCFPLLFICCAFRGASEADTTAAQC